MIASDTNLVIRHLTADDARQSAKVRQLFGAAELRREHVFLSHIVLCEVCWVLKAVYRFEKAQIAMALQALLDDSVFHVQNRALVESALTLYKRHAGQFSDHLLGAVARDEGATTTYTFDKAVGKHPNFTLLE